MTYREIAAVFAREPKDVHTVPTNGQQPRWFYVSTDNGTMFVEQAKNHIPSSRITVRRKLKENEFDTILEIYQRRKRGMSVAREATEATKSQVYWYGIFSVMDL